LSPARARVLAPVGKLNDCASCTDNCCIGKHSTVQLRLRDIATLIDIGRSDLLTHDKPTFTPEELRKRPALGRQVSSTGWQVFPVLKQNRFHACLALTDLGRCALFPHWPLSCARFPYALHADKVEVFYSRRCESFWVRGDKAALAQAMVVAAVAAYNERIKDFVILAYARERLVDLGLARHLRPFLPN
jgi:Fe-S-cluster containining protein